MIVSAGAMAIASLLVGWSSRATQQGETHREDSPWLHDSLTAVQDLDHVHEDEDRGGASKRPPIVLAVVVTAAGCLLSFIVFWEQGGSRGYSGSATIVTWPSWSSR